jgi:signal transduction histidine kinase
MEGLDTNWINAGARRNVAYANLDEGTYVFKVKACNNEGVWNNVPAGLVIVIKPPLLRRWWFDLIVAAVVSGVLYIIHRYNLRQLNMRVQLRDKIASDFHDELGSTLSSISLYSEMAMTGDFADKQRTTSILSLIGESSRSTVSAMQDMIWTIEPKNDKMLEVVYRMREYAYPLAELKAISLTLDADEAVQKLELSMDTRKNIYLVFKEGLNNAFKYAAATAITVRISKKGNLLSLEIKDNGKGFDPANLKAGNGLRNMQKRAGQAGGTLSIKSAKGSGTEILFSCPVG